MAADCRADCSCARRQWQRRLIVQHISTLDVHPSLSGGRRLRAEPLRLPPVEELLTPAQDTPETLKKVADLEVSRVKLSDLWQGARSAQAKPSTERPNRDPRRPARADQPPPLPRRMSSPS